MNYKVHGAGPLNTSGITPSSLAGLGGRLLTERARALGIHLSALPGHVVDHFRAIAQEEAALVEAGLDEEIARLQKRAEARLRDRLAKRMSFKSVGRAFNLPAKSSTVETPASTPPPGSGEQGGVA